MTDPSITRLELTLDDPEYARIEKRVVLPQRSRARATRRSRSRWSSRLASRRA
jgi:hypothetical protein